MVILAVINSAVSAVYYLRIAGACFFAPAAGSGRASDEPSVSLPRQLGATLAAVGALVLGFAGSFLVEAARQAGDHRDQHLTKPLVQVEPTLEVTANNRAQ
ncbi:MAG: hypothetical protein HC898_08495 [Phycisphaerales bacterium]|nr:hypothetical protein [Phycisphaerales bacterium]